ncbi:hypothetical protein [Rhodanobacter sp. T12-5]|uniref:hypothetical protein n=1 Tax=Rhodanobacter sp. T12-5 TaxID=2024611 RepID=UPI0011EFCBC8|nr:hypothetical protein [Rhodanobacter sp. T12-5]
MNALAELRKRASTPANPANPANQGRQRAVDSQDSQDSQRVEVKSHFLPTALSVLSAPVADALKPIRAHLLALAAAEGIDAAHVHRLHDLDVAACVSLDALQLAGYLAMLADTAGRHAGRAPAGDTAAMHCEQCGPVWIHPDIAAVLPVVDGWPRALGCPWCFVRKAGGHIPRPSVTCEGCAHFTPDTINPAAGMGTCGAGMGMHWPITRHACGTHSTRKPHEEA